MDDLTFASRSDDYAPPCRPECQQPRPPRNVIYGGPCPPDPELDCQPPLPPPPCDPIWYHREPDDRPGYAHYAQNGSMSVSAFDPLPFDSLARQAAGSFEQDGSAIGICRYGTYMATCALTLPRTANVNTRIYMQLDGEVIPGSTVNVVKEPGAPGSALIQAVFDVVRPGARLEVVTTNDLCIIADDECETIASLTIVQIDGHYNHKRKDHDGFERECRHHQRRHCNCGR